ncbi:uncharacterized protein LOC114528984 isoform X2 [Dendronephthya gigantea]|nr:uncharacterized protein LOC114528984 isoform X2 [Dendronephthya gigantea]
MSHRHFLEKPKNTFCDRIKTESHDNPNVRILLKFQFKRRITALNVVDSVPWKELRKGDFENKIVTIVEELSKFDLKPRLIKCHRADKKVHVIKIMFQSFDSRLCENIGLRKIFTQAICFKEREKLLKFLENYVSFVQCAISSLKCRSMLEFRISLKEREVCKNRFQNDDCRYSKTIDVRCKIINNVSVKPATCNQSTQTSDNDIDFKKSNLEVNFESKNSSRKPQENDNLRRDLCHQKFLIRKIQRQLELERQKYIEEEKRLASEILSLKNALRKMDNEKRVVLAELGNILVKNDLKTNEARAVKKFQEIFPRKAVNHGGDDTPEYSPMSIVNANISFSGTISETRIGPVEVRPQQSNNQQKRNRPQNQDNNESGALFELIPFPVEVAEGSSAESIGNPVVLNGYKQLLLTISYSLLLGDIVEFKCWARENFSIETKFTATDVILDLDGKGVISVSDLGVLRVFFQSIKRIDLVCLIDEFNCGDHAMLKLAMCGIKARSVRKTREITRSQAHLSRILTKNHPSSSSSPVEQSVASESSRSSQCIGSSQHDASRGCSRYSRRISRSVENEVPTSERFLQIPTDRTRRENERGDGNRSRAKITSSAAEKRVTKQNLSGQLNMSPGSNNVVEQLQVERWLCNHYKRRCMVKFDCCDKYWACHRCHNETSTCQQKKLKSRDTTMVKCMECGKEQQFGENDQFCVACNSKFADYYCGLCKHLTGMDDHPYHCEKCGICRIHGDRSYHCDVCGVCLDVQLRGNHKCRPDSAHDNCGICFEDAFTGCQILPCSHKVHKECVTRMIQNGM